MRIYIPLCLYFNKEAGWKEKHHIQIYIPLCLYFNEYLCVLFTELTLFTFHYVSILICQNRLDIMYQSDLHSIMSLF